MFFLRNHGGHHERVSTQDEESSEVTNNSSNGNLQPIRESDLQSALASVGMNNHNHQLPSLSPASPSSSLPTSSPLAENNNTAVAAGLNDPSSSNGNNSGSPTNSERGGDTGAPTESTTLDQHNHYITTNQQQHHQHPPTIIRTPPTCTILLLFFLLRLWIEAIIQKDIGLIFISLMGTTWCYRWYLIRREAEREWLDSVNADNNELTIEGGDNNNTTTTTNNRTGRRGVGADAAMDYDPDLGLMSFQAQLALAILESQRQMFENGGYGGNDDNNNSENDGLGVTNEAKQSWDKYEWGKCVETTEQLRSVIHKSDSKTKMGKGEDYGSVSVEDLSSSPASQHTENTDDCSSLSKLEEGGLLVEGENDDEEEPSCSICLCEYETGETVFKLPCNHIYHELCLTSWTENHVRCPLCQYDLMTGFQQPESTTTTRQRQNNEAEQMAFRNMALSALGGRRIRARTTRRGGGGGGRRGTRYSSALAAAEDSIV